MKSVCEDYITEQIVFRTIIDIKRGVELEVWCDVACETDCRRVFRPALEIDLQAPSLIEVIGITEDRFVFVAGMNSSDDDFLMLSVIASFDVWLRIDVQVRRPIDEPHGKKKRLFPQQSDLRPENPFVRLKDLMRDPRSAANPESRFGSTLSSLPKTRGSSKE